MLPQDTVGVDLRDEFTGQLTIDGQRDPEDQFTGDPSLGQVFFEPGPARTFSELSEGRAQRASIECWPTTIKTVDEARKAKQLICSSYTLVRSTVG